MFHRELWSEPFTPDAIAAPGRRFLLFICTLLLTAGCADDHDDFFPLRNGLTWHYHIERTTMDGTRALKHITETLTAMPWQGTDIVPKTSAAGDTFYYRRGDKGIHRVAIKRRDSRELTPHPTPIMVIPIPPTTGTSWRQVTTTAVLENTGPPWETLFRIIAPIEIDYRVESSGETVVVPAGTFNDCIKVFGTGEASVEVGNYIGRTNISVEIAEWYAPGVGLIKSQRTERTGADAIDFGSLEVELEHFIR